METSRLSAPRKGVRDEARGKRGVGDEQQRRGDARAHHGCGERHEDQRGAKPREPARRRGDERRDQQEDKAGTSRVRAEGGRAFHSVMAAHSRLKTGVNALMPGTRPGMTKKRRARLLRAGEEVAAGALDTVPSGWIEIVVSPVAIARSATLPRHAMIVLQDGNIAAKVIFCDTTLPVTGEGICPHAVALLVNVPWMTPFDTDVTSRVPLWDFHSTARAGRAGRRAIEPARTPAGLRTRDKPATTSSRASAPPRMPQEHSEKNSTSCIGALRRCVARTNVTRRRGGS